MPKKKKTTPVQNGEHVELKATTVFFQNMNSDKTVLVNRGGAGSSKSHSICQLLHYKFLTEKRKRILIVRKSLPSLRVSVLWLIEKIQDSFGIRTRIKEEKRDLNYRFNSNIIHLGSVDDIEKMKSTEWNYIWMEEATEFSYDEFVILRSRLRAPSEDGVPNKMYLSFNPTDEYHWIKDKLLKFHDDCAEIHSTYKDNPFLDAENRGFIEKSIEYDPSWHRIYGLGEWGKLENLIYPRWDTCPGIPKGNTVYGLDFGFNSETALIKITGVGDDMYEEELLYRTGLTNSMLIDHLKDLIPETERNRPMYADAAEPDRIAEIKMAGFNIKPAQKNIKDGIDFVQRKKIHVLETSTNIQKEKKGYSWKKDRNGNILDEPIPLRDHLMDAERYALYSHFGKGKDFKIRWL